LITTDRADQHLFPPVNMQWIGGLSMVSQCGWRRPILYCRTAILLMAAGNLSRPRGKGGSDLSAKLWSAVAWRVLLTQPDPWPLQCDRGSRRRQSAGDRPARNRASSLSV